MEKNDDKYTGLDLETFIFLLIIFGFIFLISSCSNGSNNTGHSGNYNNTYDNYEDYYSKSADW